MHDLYLQRLALAIAAAIVLTFVATAVALTALGTEHANVRIYRVPAAAARQPAAALTRPAAPRPTAAPATPKGRAVATTRKGFAQELDRRFQDRKRGVRVRAIGDGDKVFEAYWPAHAVDRGHMNDLQTSRAFHQELRSRGFKRFQIRVGNAVKWSMNL